MNNRYYVGVDIGGTKTAVVLGDAKARILERICFETQTGKGPDFAIGRMVRSIGAIIPKNKVDGRVAAMGISCGGPLDSEKGMILSPPNLPGWDRIPIAGILMQKFGIKTYLQNDADACAIAEWRFGAGRGRKNLVFLTFGTGLGAGLILNNQLYAGFKGMAGEVGHIRLAKTGPVGYGKAGSFEGFCSGGGIAQLARRMVSRKLKKGEKVFFCPEPELVKEITAQDVGRAAEAGDLLAREILKISGRYLGLGLSVLIDILNPEMIIIGSIYERCRQFIQPYMEEIIRKEALTVAANDCKIVPSELKEEIGDYACLAIAWNNDPANALSQTDFSS